MNEPVAAVLDELRSRGDGEVWFSNEDLGRWAGTDNQAKVCFFDEIGWEIARQYDEGRLNYEFCDNLVNQLWGLVVDMQVNDPEAPWPDDFYKVFLAFDDGEYYRTDDCSDDPVGERTNPQIQALLATRR